MGKSSAERLVRAAARGPAAARQCQPGETSGSGDDTTGDLMVRSLWVCVSLLSLIMIVVTMRRLLHLSAPGAELDTGFARHPVLTLAHILPGIVFVVLGPFQFMAGLRKRHPALHRWMG